MDIAKIEKYISYNSISKIRDMEKTDKEVLSEKYAITILKYIYDRGTIKKYDLLEVIKSSWSLDKILNKLEKAGFIEIKEQIMGRRVYYITLTEKGRVIAGKLKSIEESLEEKKEPIAEISKEKYDQVAKDWNRLSFKPKDTSVYNNQFSYFIFRAFDSDSDRSIYFKESNFDGQGHDRTVKISILIDEDSIVRLYCDVDQSTTCWHVQYAWTLPKVQAWVQKYLKLHIEQLQRNEKSNDTLRKNINSTDNQNEENKR
ncbi:MAG: hypothetical protein GPW19_03030 [Euryarchaeota archaeon]|nr:hypothetical protein [Euryarchaeota archaeon]